MITRSLGPTSSPDAPRLWTLWGLLDSALRVLSPCDPRIGDITQATTNTRDNTITQAKGRLQKMKRPF